MIELTNWMLVFLRVSAMLAVFPVFSARNFPVQLRLALGALTAILVSPNLPTPIAPASDFIGLIGQMIVEVGVGLILGFASRMVFFAVEMAGGIITAEMGLSLPPSMNPLSETSSTAPTTVLYYLAAMLWVTLDLHHWTLIGFQKSYEYLPVGAAHISESLVRSFISRTGGTFLVALQMSAPIMAVSFIITLVFSVLGRAVPQMNVFVESYAIRTLVGLSVFGLSMQLMSQHIVNYLRRLPEDLLNVSHLLASG